MKYPFLFFNTVHLDTKTNFNRIGHYFILLLLLSSNFAYGQKSDKDLNRKIAPLPPNVASLLKFNETPVNNFNGTADVNIPLIEVKESSTDIPISLSYHTGGLKVDEEASWTGLGWNLNVGGVIQEIIVGEPDNRMVGYHTSDYNRVPKPYSFYSQPQNGTFDAAHNFMESGFCYPDSSGTVSPFSYNMLFKSNFEFDLFSFNFSGYSGKFIMPDYKNGSCLDKQNIVFTSDGSFSAAIKATTPDGTQYIFGQIGYTDTQVPCDPTQPPSIKVRTWYITKIIYPNNRQVNFSYTKTVSRSLPTLSENSSFTHYSGGQQQYTVNLTQNYSTIDNYWLSNISFDQGRIDFISSPRLDMENGMKLDAIRLYNYTNPATILKEIDFNYDYFQSTDVNYGNDWTLNPTVFNSSICSAQSSYQPSENFKQKRLKLLTVKISDGLPVGNKPTYQFQYNTLNLPPKTSLAKDIWGYYNGAISNTTLLPDYNHLGYWDSNIPYTFLNSSSAFPNLGQRATQPVYVQANMLKSIITPTGSYSAFKYESNSVPNSAFASQNIVDDMVKVSDLSNGIDQAQFTVPSIGYQVYDPQTQGYFDGNPAKIHVTLFCCGYRSQENCNNGFCTLYDPNFPTKGLYCKLEYFDTSQNQWKLTPGHTYDLSNSVIINGYGDVDISEGLKPGTYRVTANYPDGAPVMDYSKTIASIMVTYKVIQTVATTPQVSVGGLRIKSIADYNSDGSIGFQRNYTYKRGRLMTTPTFYRVSGPQIQDITAPVSANCSANVQNDVPFGFSAQNGDGILLKCGTGTGDGLPPVLAPLVNYTTYSLYSNPVANYSYSAMGALVGYDTVEVTHDQLGKSGKSEFIYNCIEDNYSSFTAAEMPGIPTSPYLINGSLKKQTDFKKDGSAYYPVRSSEFEYSTLNTEIKWCYKTEYITPMAYGSYTGGIDCSILPSGLTFPSNFVLHFYPLKFGKVKLTKQTDRLFTDVGIVTKITSYDYNNYLQLRRTTQVNSIGDNIVNESYYPTDYSVSSGFLGEMKSRNMLDYPIETFVKKNALATSGQYTEYSVHDNMVTPLNVFVLKSILPLSLSPSIPLNIKSSAYEQRVAFSIDQYGNINSQHLIDGTSKSYLWDYKNTYPVAEITNSASSDFAYTSFEGENGGNWNISSAIRTTSGFTGTTAYNLTNGSITKDALNGNKIYIVSYWSQSGSATVNGITAAVGVKRNSWTYYEHKLAVGVTNIIVAGNVVIDELRLSPADAQLSTYTYQVITGVNTITDAKNLTSFYNYDSFQRLNTIKDKDGNIIKNFDYNYSTNWNSTNSNVYSNIAMSKTFTKNNCAQGSGIGSDVVYQVPAGTYISTIHPGEANEMAFAAIDANGQANANSAGGCVLPVCSTPVIYDVKSESGSGITVTCAGASAYAGVQLLFIKDPSTGQTYSTTSAQVSATTVTATVPVKGKVYRFMIMTTGAYCNGVTSVPFDVLVN